MAKEVLFVQGGGEGAHDVWDDKLVDSLRRELGEGYAVHYPRMPNEADPDYAAWKAALAREFDRLGAGAVLVGHSIGATILLHVLAEAPLKHPPAGLFLLAAPFIGEGGWSAAAFGPTADLADRLPPGVPLFFYHGRDDETAPLAHVDLYAKAVPAAQIRRLDGRNHQLNNDLAVVAADIRRLG